MINDSLGDRMKRNYEAPARHRLTRRMPTIIRVDGRAFHTLTAPLQKPFDPDFILAMQEAAWYVASQIQGFKLAYVQSDEASFVLTDYDNLQTDPWFGAVQSKIETIAASAMTAKFNTLIESHFLGLFDARAFNIPESDVANYFLWRARDWHRNSVSMYARAHFSHAELRGKCMPEMHEMLHAVNRNWSNDLSDTEKNGSFIVDGLELLTNIRPNYPEIATLWDSVNPSMMNDQNTTNEPVENENVSA